MTAPVRLRLSRRAGFDLQAHSRQSNGLPALNVARPSRWGNPFVVGKDGTRKDCVAWFIAMTCGKFRITGTPEIAALRDYNARLIRAIDGGTLRGRNLACHCAPMSDQFARDRHPLSSQLPPAVLHNVTHAYGGTGLNAGYRDYFYASKNNWTMKAALYHGLFAACRRDKGRDGSPDMIMYALTDLGRNVARGEQQLYERA